MKARDISIGTKVQLSPEWLEKNIETYSPINDLEFFLVVGYQKLGKNDFLTVQSTWDNLKTYRAHPKWVSTLKATYVHLDGLTHPVLDHK